MKIGILSAELGQEDVDENKRLSTEILLSGHRPVMVNYRQTVVAITKNGRMLCKYDKKGNLKTVKLDGVIPRINETDEQSINAGALALEILLTNGVYATASPTGILLSKSKLSSQIALSEANVPTPRTAVISDTEHYDVDQALKIVEPNPNRRLVIKTIIGSWGRGVMAANSRSEARAILEGFLANGIPVLAQQFIEPRRAHKYADVRLIIVDGKVVASMKRQSTKKDEIRANLSLGGEGSPYKPTHLEIETAEKAAHAVGMAVAGVDIIPSSKGPIVLEVNASPGFLVEQVADVNVAKAIVGMITDAVDKSTPVSKLLELPDAIKSDSRSLLSRLPLGPKKLGSKKRTK